jgi:hypothetical protein
MWRKSTQKTYWVAGGRTAFSSHLQRTMFFGNFDRIHDSGAGVGVGVDIVTLQSVLKLFSFKQQVGA